MSTFRKLLYTPHFSTQSTQMGTPVNKKISRNQKLSKTKVFHEATPLLFDTQSSDLTPGFSKKVKINHILRFYSTTASPKLVDCEKSARRANRAAEGPATARFGFSGRKTRTEDKMFRAKQEVLRTIKRMVEENRTIRERLLTLRQMRSR
ncbi:hypothetical protein DNTS_012138 [Danionella cerebrum]|uniref:Uncharacterized protein n=1 Tax=Danionella cerebrum TaxID=2873325 RepID=A0A553PUF4_9TELE|nr:hypothetical protein DNTS_012138 [Danionella translucida]